MRMAKITLSVMAALALAALPATAQVGVRLGGGARGGAQVNRGGLGSTIDTRDTLGAGARAGPCRGRTALEERGEGEQADRKGGGSEPAQSTHRTYGAASPAPGRGYTVPPRGCGGIGRRARFRSVWG